jgi:zinc protease
MMADVVRNPLFDAEELTRSGSQYAAFIKQQMKDTGAMAKAKLMQSLYPADSVYFDKPFEELLAELTAIKAGDLAAFHAAHYSPKGMIITVVGDIDPDKVVADLTAGFGDWTGPEPKSIEIAPVTAPKSAQRIEVPMADKASVDIVIGLPAALKRSDPDFFAARLANAALGQDTLSSRLGLVVREQHGLTYGIYSSFEDVQFGGAPWCIKLTVNPANVEKALALIDEVMGDYVAKGISSGELADEAGRAAGTFQVMLRTSAGIAQMLTQYEFLGLGLASLDSYAADLKKVTKKQADEAIRKYFRLANCVVTLAGTFAAKVQS